MKKALINLLNAMAKRIAPCSHKWRMFRETYVKGGYGDTYSMMHFHCEKCGEYRKVKSY